MAKDEAHANEMANEAGKIKDINEQPYGTVTTRWSALHFAAYNGAEETVKWLVANGADPFLNCRDHAKPIETAMTQGHYHIQKWLWQEMRKIKHAGPKPELGAWGGAGQIPPDPEEGEARAAFVDDAEQRRTAASCCFGALQ